MLRHRLFLILFFAGVMPLHAATITVDDDGPADYTSIQAAIDAAVSGQDEVVVAPGTYNEAIDLKGKAITLRGVSGNPSDTVVDGTGNFHVVQCVKGETSTTVLSGFTFTGGSANGSDPNDTRGGGMFNFLSSPTVARCVFTGNSAQLGGAIYSLGGTPAIFHCVFRGNAATEGGGAMFNLGSDLTITNCTFTGNTSNDIAGGLYNLLNRPIVENCTFSGNRADSIGGAMVNALDTATVTNCVFWGNLPDEIYDTVTTSTVRYSVVQGGRLGAGNIDADPLFVDPNGPDNIIGTADDDLHLSVGSPCINSGDLDFITIPNSKDIDGQFRVLYGRIDMGVDEFSLAGDFDLSGLVDTVDLSTFVQEWLLRMLVHDVAPNGPDGTVNWRDFGAFQAEAGPTYDVPGFVADWLGTGASLPDLAPNGGDGFFDLQDFAVRNCPVRS